MKIGITIHGKRRLISRFGKGINPTRLAQRVWSKVIDPPIEWEVPYRNKSHYRRCGDHVFVYSKGRFGDMVLVTVVGPFRNGDTWERIADEDS